MKYKPKKFLKYLKTKGELDELTDKQLEDIGIPRCEIEKIAFKEVYNT